MSSVNEGFMHFYTKSGSDLVEQMTIDNNGNIGIGNTNPKGRVDINISTSGGESGLILKNISEKKKKLLRNCCKLESIKKSMNIQKIENIPDFNNDNSNQQQRFVTLIDILYEKSIKVWFFLSKPKSAYLCTMRCHSS